MKNLPIEPGLSYETAVIWAVKPQNLDLSKNISHDVNAPGWEKVSVGKILQLPVLFYPSDDSDYEYPFEITEPKGLVTEWVIQFVRSDSWSGFIAIILDESAYFNR